MDNLCHTLAGLTLGEAGLKRRAPLASVTLMIAANIPDVDVLVFATDMPSVAFRRGWTHGALAESLWPFVIVAAVYAIGRRRNVVFHRSQLLWLVLLSYAGVLSHVGLDWLNNYGVRLLMPFSERWFYGDSVFIIDLWLWAIFGVGAWLARTRSSDRPARIALALAAVYIAAMVASARLSRDYVIDAWRAAYGQAPAAVMVGPQPLTPFTRAVIVDEGAAYTTGTFEWLPPHVSFDSTRVPKNDGHPAVHAAIAREPRFGAVLRWARFPYYEIESTPAGDAVTLRDLRFGSRVGGVRAVVAASAGSSRPADPSR